MWDLIAESYIKNGKRNTYSFFKCSNANTEISQSGLVCCLNSLDPTICLHLQLTMALNGNPFILYMWLPKLRQVIFKILKMLKNKMACVSIELRRWQLWQQEKCLLKTSSVCVHLHHLRTHLVTQTHWWHHFCLCTKVMSMSKWHQYHFSITLEQSHNNTVRILGYFKKGLVCQSYRRSHQQSEEPRNSPSLL